MAIKKAFSTDILNQMVKAAKIYKIKEALSKNDKEILKEIKKGIQPKLSELNHHFVYLINMSKETPCDKDFPLKQHDIDFKDYYMYKANPQLFDNLTA